MRKKFSVKQFVAGNCYSYILSSGSECIIVDPHITMMARYEEYIDKQRLRVKYVIDTHTHADHFSLAAVLKKRFKVSVVMSDKAISDVADKRLKEGDDLIFGEATLKVMYAPGHTDDTMNLYGNGFLFTGDVLLIGSVGRTDFQNGSPESMFETLSRIKKLPASTVICPAHDYNGKRFSVLRKELKSNPFLVETNKARFVKNALEKELPKPFNIDNIIRVNQKGEAAQMEMLGPPQVEKIISDEEFKIIDVRSREEFESEHIEGSVNVPLNELGSRIKEIAGEKKTCVFLCRTGTRSVMAADMFIQSGVRSKVMDGGILKWAKLKLPLVKGRKKVSIERQIRVIAGSLVLLGIILAELWHPGFVFISVWVACGLLFAGITDNCLMGMFLMKLPYNKKQYLSSNSGGGTCSISQ